MAAGEKLARLEQLENDRMDAFRVAMGLPSAEAQRQAEWRAAATRQLAEAGEEGFSPRGANKRARLSIGPQIPRL